MRQQSFIYTTDVKKRLNSIYEVIHNSDKCSADFLNDLLWILEEEFNMQEQNEIKLHLYSMNHVTQIWKTNKPKKTTTKQTRLKRVY